MAGCRSVDASCRLDGGGRTVGQVEPGDGVVTDELRIGVVGAGDVATRDYLPEAHRLHPRARIVAIASSDGRRAAAVAERFALPASCAGYEQLLARDDVDAVVNLTPARLHGDVNRAAIEAGRHLYSEKPFAPTVPEAVELTTAAERQGVVLVCAPSVMVFPQVARARQLLAAGAIGSVWNATGQFLGGLPPWAGYESDPSPFFAVGSGPLVDIGVYPLHALTGLLGPVRRVTAMATRSRADFVQLDGSMGGRTIPVDVDDTWHVTLRFDCGAVATVRSDFATLGASATPDVELDGETGTIAFQLIDMTAPLRVHDGSSWTDEHLPEARADGPDHLLGVAHLVDCVLSGTSNVLSAEHATHVIDIVHAADRSATEGVAADLTTTFSAIGSTEGAFRQ